MRELEEHEKKRVVNIFGKGSKGQQKISLLTPDEDVRGTFEDAVIAASLGSKIE